MKIYPDFDKNISILEEAIKGCPDYIINQLKMKDGTRFLVFYIDNMVNSDVLNISILPYLLDCESKDFTTERLPVGDVSPVLNLDEAMAGIATGGVFFLLEGHTKGFQARIENLISRTPESSENEKNMRGARDSFVENTRINMAMLRTRVANHDLKFNTVNLGTSTHQTVAIAYMENIASPRLLKKLEKKIKSLNYDGFLGTAYVEQMISDSPYSPFPQSQVTERVDKAEAALLEGRFLIFVQGAPNAIILPVNFWGFFQAVDDFTHPPLIGTIIGIFRFFAAALTIFLPAAYVAVLTFHYYAVPLNLFSTLASSRSNVLFSPLAEALVMEFLFEIIREASIRLPASIGGTIGIVGGIIIGETAVQAGLVSNLMVIIVAITAVAGFALPSHNLSAPLRYCRFGLIILAGMFGMEGLLVAATLLIMHLMNLTSLGQPYMEPLFPFRKSDWKNTIIRMPYNFMKQRPTITDSIDPIRGENNGNS